MMRLLLLIRMPPVWAICFIASTATASASAAEVVVSWKLMLNSKIYLEEGRRKEQEREGERASVLWLLFWRFVDESTKVDKDKSLCLFNIHLRFAFSADSCIHRRHAYYLLLFFPSFLLISHNNAHSIMCCWVDATAVVASVGLCSNHCLFSDYFGLSDVFLGHSLLKMRIPFYWATFCNINWLYFDYSNES